MDFSYYILFNKIFAFYGFLDILNLSEDFLWIFSYFLLLDDSLWIMFWELLWVLFKVLLNEADFVIKRSYIDELLPISLLEINDLLEFSVVGHKFICKSLLFALISILLLLLLFLLYVNFNLLFFTWLLFILTLILLSTL